MRKIQLINVDNSGACEEQTGTCELCFGSMWCENPVYVFKLDNGDKIAIDGYWWDWGDYDEVYIHNFIDFASWLDKQEFDDDTKFDTDWLINVVDDYNRGAGDTGFRDMNGNPIYMDSTVVVLKGNEQIKCTVGYDGYYAHLHYFDPTTKKTQEIEPDDNGSFKPVKVLRLQEHMTKKTAEI